MKKLFLCILCLLMCSVCAAAPAKKVVLWYQVPEAVLEAQNLENDVEKGKTEFEAFLMANYGKRFPVQMIKQAAPDKELTAADVSLVTRPNWVPIVVKLDLAGVGRGDKLVGKYSTVKVALKESTVVDGKLFSYDYGIKEYDSSMLRVAGYVIASEDAKDSTSAPVRVADFTSKIGQDIKGMKIALPKEYLGEGIDPEVKETILNAAKHFEKLGATVEEVSLPHSKYGVAVYYIIASSEASSNLQRFDGIRYGFRAEDAKNLDDIYVNTRSQGFGDEVKRRIMLGTFSLSSGYYDAYYKKAGQVRTLIIQDFEKVFADYDLILGPTAPSVAFDLDSLNHDPVAMYLADLLTIPVNLAGLPGISIPAGFAQGLPVGLQLIGPKYSEETIYQAAAAFEATTDYHKQQPLIFGGDN